MLTSKQRAYLRGLANSLDSIFQVGKGGISENLTAQLNDVLRVRELVKLRVLETVGETPKDIAAELVEATGADCVQVIGSRIVLYKPNPEEPKIELPK